MVKEMHIGKCISFSYFIVFRITLSAEGFPETKVNVHGRISLYGLI